MPAIFLPNRTLTDSTDANQIMDEYRQSTAGCVSVVNEIFEKYCVRGVFCNAGDLKGVSRGGIYMQEN